MDETHYKILEFLESQRGGNTTDLVSKGRILRNVEADDSDIENELDYLRGNYIQRINNSEESKKYKILLKGIDSLENKKLRDSIKGLDASISELHSHQEKSSSVETIFTFALITFSYLQIAEPNLGPHVPEMILGLGIGWALLVGGLTPFRMTGKRFKQIRNRLV